MLATAASVRSSRWARLRVQMTRESAGATVGNLRCGLDFVRMGHVSRARDLIAGDA